MSRSAMLDVLVASIERVLRPHPVRVGIDGVDGAGKTTLADELADALRARGRTVIRSSIDSFHNPPEIRHRRGLASASGYYLDSFNLDALQSSLLEPLGPGGSRRYRTALYDYRVARAVDAPILQAPEQSLLLFDGIFLQRPELRAHWDYSIFVRASFDVTLARAEVRDLAYLGGVEEVRTRYRERYIPGQQIYLRECDPERRANIIVDNDDPEAPGWSSRAADSGG